MAEGEKRTPDPVTWERRDKAYRAIYEALGGQNPELINWERRGEALKAIHDAASNLRTTTIFGAYATAIPGWQPLMFLDNFGQGYACQVAVPSGKTFKLWALGRIQPDDISLQQLGARDDTRGHIIKLTEQGALYEKYSTPFTVEGPCLVSLGNQNNDTVDHMVSGYMVFSIE